MTGKGDVLTTTYDKAIKASNQVTVKVRISGREGGGDGLVSMIGDTIPQSPIIKHSGCPLLPLLPLSLYTVSTTSLFPRAIIL
jgi:hypothetical protein